MKAKIIAVILLLLFCSFPAKAFEYYVHGVGKVIDDPISQSISLNIQEMPVTYVVGPDSKGYLYGVEYKKLRHERRKILRSKDGITWDPIYEHKVEIKSLYLWKDVLFFSDANGSIFMKNGSKFEEVLRLEKGKYAIWWSWAGNNEFLLIGEYGAKSNSARVYRTFDGRHFEVFFDIGEHYKVKDNGCHIHLVSVDPYDDTVYIGVGDNPPYRGLYIYKNGKWIFRNTNNHILNSIMNSGPLATTYDKKRVLFYSDNFPQIVEYNKEKDELKPLAAWFGEYYRAEMKFYDAVKDPKTGIYYAVSVDYNKKGVHYLWISLDGVTWRKISGGAVNGTHVLYPLHMAKGYLYMNNLRMKLFTREEALKLIYGENKPPISITLVEDRPIVIPIQTEKPLEIVVEGKKLRNYLSPKLTWTSVNGTLEKRDEFLVFATSSSSAMLKLQVSLEKGWYTLGMCMKSSRPWDEINPVRVTIHTKGKSYGGLAQVSTEWRPFYYVFNMPEKGIAEIRIAFNGSAVYEIGCLFLSNDLSTSRPNGKFLEGEDYSKNVTLSIDGKIYHIGDLKPGEKKVIHLENLQTLELLSGGAVDLLITEGSKEEKENFNRVLLSLPAVVAFFAFVHLIKYLKQRLE